jgi:hypothetical protein
MPKNAQSLLSLALYPAKLLNVGEQNLRHRAKMNQEEVSPSSEMKQHPKLPTTYTGPGVVVEPLASAPGPYRWTGTIRQVGIVGPEALQGPRQASRRGPGSSLGVRRMGLAKGKAGWGPATSSSFAGQVAAEKQAARMAELLECAPDLHARVSAGQIGLSAAFRKFQRRVARTAKKDF